MNQRRLFWHILPAFLAVILGAVGFTTLNARSQVRRFYTNQVRSSLETQAHLLAEPVKDRLEKQGREGLDALCKEMGRQAQVRVTIVLRDGTVVADSDQDPAVMDNHGSRPEISEAFAGKVGTAVRYSHTLQQEMMYVAVPTEERGSGSGPVVRMAYSLAGLYEPVDPTMGRLLTGGLLVALVAAFASFMISRRIVRPLEKMTEVASAFAAGDFDRRVPLGEPAEVGQLADALNRMASRVQEQLGTISDQRN